MHLSPDTLFANGKYRIVKHLGAGASGDVYLVRHLRLDRLEAIKVLVRSNADDAGSFYSEVWKRFALEAALGARLRHSNLTEVYDHDAVDGVLYLTMQYASEGTVADRIKAGVLPIEQCVRWLLDAARGLEALHDADVIHRDVKPSNLLVLRDGRVTVADLGLAQINGQESLRARLGSMAGMHPGTPDYMSPEHNKPATLQPTSDVYSLGCVGFELLTGKRYAQMQSRVMAPSELRPEVPQWLDALVMRMLAPEPGLLRSDANDPRKRYVNFAAIIDKLAVEKAAHEVAKAQILGIYLSEVTVKGGLVDQSGIVKYECELSTPVNQGREAILTRMAEVAEYVQDMVRRHGGRVDACGVGVPGIVDWRRGRVLYAGGALDGWSGTDVATALSTRLNLRVKVDNDVNTFALAEQSFGVGRGLDDALYVMVDDGIGGALVLGGRVRRGASCTAGELGEVVTGGGILDSYATAGAIVRKYRKLAIIDHKVDLRQLAVYACDGDEHAIASVRDAAVLLGRALCGILNTLDPHALVIFGRVPQMLGDFWWKPFEETIRSNPLPGPASIRLLSAETRVNAGIVGAASLWLRDE